MAGSFLDTERSLYVGQSLAGILYGFQLCLCFQSVYYLRKTSLTWRKKQFYIWYSLLLAILNAIMLGCNTLFGQYMWIEKRDLPGGTLEFIATNGHWWVNTLANSANLGVNILSDGLLLYRCCIIFMHTFWGFILPIVLFLAVIALGITALVIVILSPSDNPNVSFLIVWVALSVAFNVMVTAMISLKIFRARAQFRRYADQNEQDTYGGVIAILTESALALTIAGLLMLVLTVLDVPGHFAMNNIWGIMMGLSPQLIILRVATGSAWSKNIARNGITTALRFHHDSRSHTMPHFTSSRSTDGIGGISVELSDASDLEKKS